MKNSTRRGLIHPNDIKTIGLPPPSPGPQTAPLPGLSHRPSRPSLNALVSPGPATSRGHTRSSSYANPSFGSGGRADARRLHSQPAFGKYAETDDEDYDDIFGKPNSTSSSSLYNPQSFCLCSHSDAANTNLAIEHASL